MTAPMGITQIGISIGNYLMVQVLWFSVSIIWAAQMAQIQALHLQIYN